MKRILAFILLICVVLNTVLVSATENQTVETGDYSRVLTVFEYLDALNGQSLDEIDVTQSITRSEFVSICVKALNLPAENGEKIFYDVDEETICFQAVSYLVQAGVLSVDSDREFRPNEDISYSEALKILLCLAGYDAYANENGGYPAGYLKAANRFEIDLNKDAGDKMSYGEALKLMFRVMTMGVYDLHTISEDSKNYSVNLKDTLLAVHRNLYVNRGTVEATATFSMTEVVCDNQEVLIDGIRYRIQDGLDITGFEGNCVEFVYQENNGQNILIYLDRISVENDIFITSKEFVDFKPNTYTLSYYNNAETSHISSVRLDKKWTVVYNGRKYTGTLKDALQGFSSGSRKGTIEIKKNPSRQDAVVIIWNYERFVIGNHDLNTRTIYNKFVSENTIRLGDYQTVSIRNLEGKLYPEEELVPDTPILVAVSADHDFINVLMMDRKVDGTVESLHQDKVIEVGGEKITVDENEWTRLGKSIEIGVKYTFWIDAFGEAVYIDLISTDNPVLGYIAASSVQNSFGKPMVKVKMLTQTGELVFLDFAKRITVDGIEYRNDGILQALYAIPGTEEVSGFGLNQASSRFEGIRLKKQLIRYRTNGKGEISFIDTHFVNTQGGETKETSLTKYEKPWLRLEYRTQNATARFERTILYNSKKTKVFTVPWTDDDGYMLTMENNETSTDEKELEYQLNDGGGKKREEDYMYKTGAQFTDFRRYNIDVYNFDQNNPYADVIVHNDDFIGDGVLAQVSEINRTVDENGEAVYSIKTIGLQGEKTYIAENNYDADILNVGDIIKGECYGEKIYKVSKIFDCQTREFMNKINVNHNVEHWYKGSLFDVEKYPTRNDYRTDSQFSKGTVTKIQDGCVFWKYDMLDTTIEYDEAADLSVVSFTVYERNLKNEPTVKAGTTDRIREYFGAGNDASYVVCLSDYNRVRYVFVFNGR